jgi:ribosomal protein S18 acetylase RimI-like enzyme
MSVSVREVAPSDLPWIRRLLRERWGSTRIVSRGLVHEADRLPGYVAEREAERVGLLTYRKSEGTCEIVTLDSLVENRGVGTALVDAIRANAALHGCRRLWLVTTNDNLPAIRFYQSRGFTVAAIREGAIAEARRLKPEIPELGVDGVPIRDEIELEITRKARAAASTPAPPPE